MATANSATAQRQTGTRPLRSAPKRTGAPLPPATTTRSPRKMMKPSGHGREHLRQLGDGGTAQRTLTLRRSAPQRAGERIHQQLSDTRRHRRWHASGPAATPIPAASASRGATSSSPISSCPCSVPLATIDFPATGQIPVGNTVTLAASASSGLPASYIGLGFAASERRPTHRDWSRPHHCHRLPGGRQLLGSPPTLRCDPSI